MLSLVVLLLAAAPNSAYAQFCQSQRGPRLKLSLTSPALPRRPQLRLQQRDRLWGEDWHRSRGCGSGSIDHPRHRVRDEEEEGEGIQERIPSSAQQRVDGQLRAGAGHSDAEPAACSPVPAAAIVPGSPSVYVPPIPNVIPLDSLPVPRSILSSTWLTYSLLLLQTTTTVPTPQTTTVDPTPPLQLPSPMPNTPLPPPLLLPPLPRHTHRLLVLLRPRRTILRTCRTSRWVSGFQATSSSWIGRREVGLKGGMDIHPEEVEEHAGDGTLVEFVQPFCVSFVGNTGRWIELLILLSSISPLLVHSPLSLTRTNFPTAIQPILDPNPINSKLPPNHSHSHYSPPPSSSSSSDPLPPYSQAHTSTKYASTTPKPHNPIPQPASQSTTSPRPHRQLPSFHRSREITHNNPTSQCPSTNTRIIPLSHPNEINHRQSETHTPNRLSPPDQYHRIREKKTERKRERDER